MKKQQQSLLAELFREVAAIERQVPAGAFVFQNGDSAEHICQVLSGRIRLVRYTEEGERCTLFFAEAGETFAEAALFVDQYHCTALADVDSCVVFFNKKLLLARLQEHPDIALSYIARLSIQVRELRTLLELRTIHSARERVLHYLLQHADPAAGNIVPIPFSLKEISQTLGLAHETLYRTLGTLEKRAGLNAVLNQSL